MLSYFDRYKNIDPSTVRWFVKDTAVVVGWQVLYCTTVILLANIFTGLYF